jgi:hypothetical protein
LPGPRTSRRISLINPVNFIPFLKTWADWPVNPLAEYDQYLQTPDLRLSRAWSTILGVFRIFLLSISQSSLRISDPCDTRWLDPALRKTVFFSPAELPRDADLVTGHIARSTLRAAHPSHRLMTILREPRCRVISHWLFWRSVPDADRVAWGSWDARPGPRRRPYAI